MDDNTPTPKTDDEKPAEEVQEPTKQEGTEDAEGAQEGAEGGDGTEGEKPEEAKQEEDKSSELPEWAQSELSRARSEAAKYRTQLREAQQKLEGAKTPEEFEAASKELTEKVASLEYELLVATVARDHNLPAELASRLKGNTEEELAADAKVLQKLVPSKKREPERLAGGLDPQDDDDFDPVAAARKARQNRW